MPTFRNELYFFSSNSCNFNYLAKGENNDCPNGYVFCEEQGSTPKLIPTNLTFKAASEHCANLSSHICESPTLKFRVQEQMLKNNSDTPKNFDEVSRAMEQANLNNQSFVVWTDFERINMTHFRKISTDESVTLNRMKP